MSYTPFNAPLLSGLLGDAEVAAAFSVKADIEAILEFEKALVAAQSEAGLVPVDAAAVIAKTASEFKPEMAALQQGVLRDGMAVPELVSQLRNACTKGAGKFLHLGATSQDAIDTSLALRLKTVNATLHERLVRLLETIANLDSRFGDRELMARTRMQAALAITVNDRLSLWAASIGRQLEKMIIIRDEIEVVQLGGPVGTLGKMEGKGAKIRKLMAEKLGLNDPKEVWHTDRSRLISYCNWLSAVCASLGKVGQDFSLMSQNGFDEIQFEGAGGSSAMGHKQNPVKAEVLVSQARFSASLASGMQQSAIHEQERSGASWTLEWMIVPQMCVVTGSALNNANALLRSVTGIG